MAVASGRGFKVYGTAEGEEDAEETKEVEDDDHDTGVIVLKVLDIGV